MKSTRVTNNIDEETMSESEDSDEYIDMHKYTRDIRDMVLSDQTMNDIIGSYSNSQAMKSQKISLSLAFKSLRANDMTEFRRIVCEQKDIINTKHSGTYLIHEACHLGNADFVCLLLFLGAKCNLMDDKGLMAQHYAVIGNDPMCVDILFLFGNHMDVQDIHGKTPYEYVKNNDMIDDKNVKFKNNFLSTDDLQNIIDQYDPESEISESEISESENPESESGSSSYSDDVE